MQVWIVEVIDATGISIAREVYWDRTLAKEQEARWRQSCWATGNQVHLWDLNGKDTPGRQPKRF